MGKKVIMDLWAARAYTGISGMFQPEVHRSVNINVAGIKKPVIGVHHLVICHRRVPCMVVRWRLVYFLTYY